MNKERKEILNQVAKLFYDIENELDVSPVYGDVHVIKTYEAIRKARKAILEMERHYNRIGQ